MNAIVKELEGEGIKVMDQTLLIQPLLPAAWRFDPKNANRSGSG